jgi:hypothetical protein
MNECVAFTQKNGEFTIEFENGKMKRGSAEQSYALHNLLCFSRLDANLTVNQTKRLGWAGAAAYAKEFFSTAWNDYVESNIDPKTIGNMTNEFNRACSRDYKNGLIDRKIKIVQVNRLDRTSLKIKLGIDSSITDLIIKL